MRNREIVLIFGIILTFVFLSSSIVKASLIDDLKVFLGFSEPLVIYTELQNQDKFNRITQKGCHEDIITITDDTFSGKPNHVFSKFVFVPWQNIGFEGYKFYVEGQEVNTEDFSDLVRDKCLLPRDPFTWDECQLEYEICLEDYDNNGYIFTYKIDYDTKPYDETTTTSTNPSITTTIVPFCDEWDDCIDGQKERVCYYKNSQEYTQRMVCDTEEGVTVGLRFEDNEEIIEENKEEPYTERIFPQREFCPDGYKLDNGLCVELNLLDRILLFIKSWFK